MSLSDELPGETALDKAVIWGAGLMADPSGICYNPYVPYPKPVPPGFPCLRRRAAGIAGWSGWSLLVLLVGLAGGMPARAQETPPERDLNMPVVVGSAEAFYPYSSLENGPALSGFAIDIAEAVARAVKLKLQWQPLANAEFQDALLSGRVDALSFWGETRARRVVADFSVPIARFQTVVVVRTDEPDIHSAADLKGRRVAVGHKGSLGELYAIEQIPEATRVYSRSTEEFLRLLAAGNCEAAILSRLTAVSLIEHLGLRNLKVLEGVRGYDVRYCLAVRKGDTLLLARFNEGLAIINRTGEYEDTYHKWFGRYEGRGITPLQIVSYVAAALALVCAGALWGYLRQRALLRRIARQAEELKEQRSLLAALYDKHPLATIVLDLPVQGPAAIVSLNQEAALLYTLDQTEAAGRPLDELNLTKELYAYLEEAVTRHRANPQPSRWEVRLPVTQRLLEVATMPLGNFGGACRLCVFSADITKRRLMDQEIAKSRRLRALGELVGGIAHEFNNLLTPIMATASMLRTAPPPAVVSPVELDIIDQSAKRAADLTRRLLAFGRKVDDPARKVQLTEAVTNCEALLKTMVDRRIDWQNDLPPDLPPILFNPTDFNQIVFNLVLNARDTLLEKLGKNPPTGWHPRLRVSLAELPANARTLRASLGHDAPAAWQRFTVEDNGLGIPPEILDRIFEPFFTTKDVGKGTGLGLSTVWHQVTDAGGEIVVDSKPGQGTAIHIYLPRWETRSPLPRAQEPAPVTPPSSVSGRIMIVEDEPLIANTTAALLRRLGHTVILRSDGVAAWDDLLSGKQTYDLLLVDLSMPRMNGVDLVSRVRGTDFSGGIVMMSGRVSEEDALALKSLRVDRIMTKPFTKEQLQATIAEVLATVRRG